MHRFAICLLRRWDLRRASLTLALLVSCAAISVGVALSLTATGWRAMAATRVTGVATSTGIACLPVGIDYLGSSFTPSPYAMQQTVRLKWTGTPTSARLIAYEFNASGWWGHNIYVNDHLVGTATGSRNSQSLCQGFEGQLPLSWPIDPSWLVQGTNVIEITIDPSLADQSWGLSRAQIEVSGPDVNGPRYEMVTVSSSFYFNWNDYGDEGTWAQLQLPSHYDPDTPTPLVIAAHGFGDTGLDALLDYADAAEAKGWLLAAADYHGEVNGGFYDPYHINGPRLKVGLRTMGSRASQYDIIDLVDYMKAHYNVDSSCVYLVGYSMGGLTALLAGAKWPHLFAAVVSDSGPTDLAQWEYETDEACTGDYCTPNLSINDAIQQEAGAFEPQYHQLMQRRVPDLYPFEYARRSPQEFALNFKHLPLLLLYPEQDQKVHPHLAQDMYYKVQDNAPDQVQLVSFPGQHGDRIADYANYTLNWLSQFRRQPADAPQHNTFTLDESGRAFWMGVQLSSDAVSVDPGSFALRTEAHFTRVRDATYDPVDQTITVDAENLAPETGSPSNFGAYPPNDLTVNLVFYLDQIGLPASGPYTVERINKDTGEFDVTYATSSNDVLRVPLSPPDGDLRQAAFLYRIVAGDRPPTYQTLQLQAGANGYSGAQDTFLSSWAVNTNYGTADKLHIHHDGPQPTIKALLRFDLSPLSAECASPNAVVRFAVLSVLVTDAPANVNVMRTEVYQVNKLWIQSEATFNQPRASATWDVAGAEGVPGDRSATYTDYRDWYAAWGQTRYGFNVYDMVQSWRAASGSNYGLMLRAAPITSDATSTNDSFWIASAERYRVSDRPRLTLVCTLEQPTPRPTHTPSATLRASPTATSTSTPTWTPSPTATSSPTATGSTPTATLTPALGQINGEVFLDADRNGQRDAGEPGRPGVLVYLFLGETIYDNVTTNAEGHFSFVGIAPDLWQVSVNLPPGYEVTTPGGNPVAVLVSAGDASSVVFGIAPLPTATLTAQCASPTPTDSPTATSTPQCASPTATPTMTPTATPILRLRYLPELVGAIPCGCPGAIPCGCPLPIAGGGV